MSSSKNPPLPMDMIQWHEGMLLSPQHLQQHDNWVISSINYKMRCVDPNNYGIIDLVYDQAALVSGKYRILKVSAMFLDGTILDYNIEKNNIKLEFDIASYLSKFSKKQAKLYLAVPIHKVGLGNIDGDTARYISKEDSLQYFDENTGDNPISLPRLGINPKILSEQELSGHYTYFPLAVINDSEDGKILEKYDPPHIYIRNELFVTDLMRQLMELLRSKVAYFMKENHLMSGMLNHEGMDILKTLIVALLPLESILNTANIKPFQLYQYLLNTAAHIISINPGAIVPIMPLYNHDEMFSCFHEVYVHTVDAVSRLHQMFSMVPFSKEGDSFSLKIKPEWINGQDIMIGVHKNPNASDSDAANWVKGMQIASKSLIQTVKECRILGTARQILQNQDEIGFTPAYGISVLSVKVQSQYININEPLVIANRTESENNTPNDIFLYVKR